MTDYAGSDAADLHRATRNAASLWTALARARAHPVVHRPGFLTVDGSERTGLRVLLLGPDPDPRDRAALTDVIRRRQRDRVVVEDPFGTVDLTDVGLTSRHMPVMIRPPGPAHGPSRSAPPSGPALAVTEVRGPDDLATVEEVVVHGFPLAALQPHRPGEAFPAALLDHPGVRCFLIRADGVPTGACLTVRDVDTVGLYWMTTLPEFRSRGVGRALLSGVLEHLDEPGVPMTLTAARAGRPLYDSLGFRPVAEATWWG